MADCRRDSAFNITGQMLLPEIVAIGGCSDVNEEKADAI